VWPFGQLSESQISILRSVIHPQIVISPLAEATKAELPLAVLDLRQERNAHSLGEGHRIVYGVAGSGKTVILIARARLVAQDPDKQVLILCFNRALAEYFQRLFAQTPNVTCLNFHQWGSQRNGVRFNEAEDEKRSGSACFSGFSTARATLKSTTLCSSTRRKTSPKVGSCARNLRLKNLMIAIS
jgi:superfamily I DNA and RNA helicase